jgi:L-fuconolactonase
MTRQAQAAEAARQEVVRVIDPDLPVVDPHHHLVHPHAQRYYSDAFQADITASGHNVLATVYVECSVMYRRRGPEALRTVGEAEFVAGMAAMGESGTFGPTRICAGFVGAADLTLGERVDEVLDALDAASGGRLRGIRGAAVWDADPAVNTGTRPFAPRGLMAEPAFRAGVRQLARRGLVYDAWQYHPQLGETCALADAVPEAVMVIDHCAGLLRIGPYAGPETYSSWLALVTEAARRPNIVMKLGGLAGGRCGFGYARRSEPPTIAELVADWRPYIEPLIELFGPDRCMFESNFPVDRVAGSYRTLWNVFKTLAADCSAAEKAALFAGTASRIYRIDGVSGPV